MKDLAKILKRIEYNLYAAETLGHVLTQQQKLLYDRDIARHQNLEYWLAKSISMTWSDYEVA